MNSNRQDSLPKTEEYPQNKEIQNPSKDLSKILESALIVALFTGALYMIGFSYFDSFFRRLSLPHMSLSLPLDIYLRTALAPCLAFSLVVLFSFWDAHKKPESLLTALRGNFVPLFICLVGLIYVTRTVNSSWVRWSYIILFSIIVILMIFACRKHNSFAHRIYKGDWFLRAFSFISFTGMGYIVAALWGDVDAKALIQGHPSEFSTFSINRPHIISLTLKGGKKFLPKKKLILIMHYGGKYYLVEKNSNPPEHPTVYILSESDVEFATIDRVK